MNEYLFNDLTNSEQKIINHNIADITNLTFINQYKNLDSAFFKTDLEKAPTRITVRCMMTNSNGEICLLHSRSKEYHAIPGGGVENSETLLQGLHREILEETGYTIKNISPLGKIHEERNDKATDVYFFTASPDQFLGTNYMEDEIEEDYELSWLIPQEALSVFKDYLDLLSENNFSLYNGSFSTLRNIKATIFFLTTI